MSYLKMSFVHKCIMKILKKDSILAYRSLKGQSYDRNSSSVRFLRRGISSVSTSLPTISVYRNTCLDFWTEVWNRTKGQKKRVTNKHRLIKRVHRHSREVRNTFYSHWRYLSFPRVGPRDPRPCVPARVIDTLDLIQGRRRTEQKK